MRTRLVLALAALLLAAILACGGVNATTGNRCYSTYPGCPATLEAQAVYATVEAAATAQK